MVKNQILCIFQQVPVAVEWHKELEQHFEIVTTIAAPQMDLSESPTADMQTGSTLDGGTLNAYRLIIVNVSTPTRQTVAFCRQLRARFSGPLLAMVPPVEEQYLLSLYNVGVDECIDQSIVPRLLVAKVTRWLLWRSHAESNQTSGQDNSSRR